MVRAIGLTADAEEALRRRGREVAHFVEDIVGGQQALGLDEIDASVAQQRGGVHDASCPVSEAAGEGKPAMMAMSGNLGSELLQHLAGAGDEGRDLDEIARRVSADESSGKTTSSAPRERAHRA